MKYSNIISLSCLSGLSAAQIWAAPGGGGWGWGPGYNGPECASSCVSSAFQPETTAWASHCSAGSDLSSCVSAACPTSVSAAPIWSFQSSVCSSWSSSCSSDTCTGWPSGWGAWGGPGGPGTLGPWGGAGGGWGVPNGNGWYTVTASTTGLSTRTVVVTSTVSGTVLETSTITQTATLVKAGAAVASSSSATATSTGAAGRVDSSNSLLALVAAAIGAVAVA